MAISEGERALRIVTIIAWVPAWGLLLPLGFVSHMSVPALGLIPMSISALFGLYLIWTKREVKKIVKILMDVFIAAFVAGTVVPGIILTTSSYRWRGHAVFASFASMPLLLSFCMHAGLILKELNLFPNTEGWFGSSACPHCNGEITPWWKSALKQEGRQTKERYAPVPVEEYTEGDAVPGPSTASTPRPSTDDETARLV